jgi:hypothetical protein
LPKCPIQHTFVPINGREVQLIPDEIYADDHEFVLAKPELFRDIVVIEAATAAPGERRNTVRR